MGTQYTWPSAGCCWILPCECFIQNLKNMGFIVCVRKMVNNMWWYQLNLFNQNDANHETGLRIVKISDQSCIFGDTVFISTTNHCGPLNKVDVILKTVKMAKQIVSVYLYFPFVWGYAEVSGNLVLFFSFNLSVFDFYNHRHHCVCDEKCSSGRSIWNTDDNTRTARFYCQLWIWTYRKWIYLQLSHN